MDNIPERIKKLPKHAQEIWIVAFNSAWEQYKGDETKCNAVAWAAVKQKYKQDEKGEWHLKVVEASIISSCTHFLGASEDSGYKWDVRIVEFGPDKQGNIFWDRDVLVNSKEKFEGAKVFALTEAQHQAVPHPYGKSVRDLVGWIDSVRATDTSLDGTLHILKTASWLRDMIVDAVERGKPDLIGLSVDIVGRAARRVVNGKEMRFLESISDVSVDVVYEPAAGGRFLRMAAAIQAGQKEEKMWKKLLASLKIQRPDLKAAIEAVEEKGDAATEDEVAQLLASVMAMPAGMDEERISAAIQAAIDEKLKAFQSKEEDDPSKKIFNEMRIIACSIILKDELKESGLPELSKQRLKKQFEGKIFDVTELRAAIKDEKEYIDKFTSSGTVTGSGNVRVTQSDLESRAKMLDDFFDGKIHSFKAAYIKITGDERITGKIDNAQRLKASLTTTSFDHILGESITRKMVKEYAATGLDDWRKIVDVVPISDFRTQRRVRFGGYGNLPTVAESGTYTALTSPTDEEATYTATKHGGTEDITIEMIRNDDVGAIRRIPQRLARAAARTLYEFVFDFLATNPTIYDGTALFTAGHGNLGSTALDATSLATGRRAMLKQIEAGSGKRLGIPPRYIAVPLELDKTAWDLIVAPDTGMYQPTTPDFMKTWKMEMIVVPYWTDTNNWYLVASPADIPTIEIGFMDGNETPELFVQDSPNVGSMFSNDKLTYKIRHIYGGAVIDYRGFYGAIVA